MFVNLTEHELVVCGVAIPPSGTVARVSTHAGELIELIDGFPIHGPTCYGEVVGLPEKVEGTIYIVSSMVALQVCRKDVVSPGTGLLDNPVRKDGKIVGVTRLICSRNYVLSDAPQVALPMVAE